MCRTVNRGTLLLLAGLLAGPHTARAQSCTVVVTPMNFGSYSPFVSTATDSAGRVTASCSGSGGYAVAIGPGTHSGNSFADRRMWNGQSYLSYQLYANAAHTTIWGDGSAGTVTMPLTRSGTLSLYGRIPPRQSVTIGNYSDTVLVTILY